VFAYEWGGNIGYHFIAITAPAANPFGSMYNSMTRLNASQASAIKPRKLRVVTAGRTDSVASLARRMAYTTLQTERFLALNGLSASTPLVPGQKIKIVTY
jgi:predicted Zn-dependent protease